LEILTMKAIQAIWENGRISLTQPVDWPDGTVLNVEPIEEPQATDLDADLMGDDPASIARWITWYDTLEPLVFRPEEEAAWQLARQQQRNWEKSRFDDRADQLRRIFE
jgi:hypothetical protein